MRIIDTYSTVICASSLIFYSYLIDPFRRRMRDRNCHKLLRNNAYLSMMVIISALIFIAGAFKLSDDAGFTIAFASIPLMFIAFLKIANAISLKKFNKNFWLIQRGDSMKGKLFFDIVASIIVVGLPLTLPIIYILLIRQFGEN